MVFLLTAAGCSFAIAQYSSFKLCVDTGDNGMMILCSLLWIEWECLSRAQTGPINATQFGLESYNWQCPKRGTIVVLNWRVWRISTWNGTAMKFETNSILFQLFSLFQINYTLLQTTSYLLLYTLPYAFCCSCWCWFGGSFSWWTETRCDTAGIWGGWCHDDGYDDGSNGYNTVWWWWLATSGTSRGVAPCACPCAGAERVQVFTVSYGARGVGCQAASVGIVTKGTEEQLFACLSICRGWSGEGYCPVCVTSP